MAAQCRQGTLSEKGILNEKVPQGGKPMSYQILFAGLCAVIAFNILVAIIAIMRAYREERRSRGFSGFAQG
jgi:hypothetical protein